MGKNTFWIGIRSAMHQQLNEIFPAIQKFSQMQKREGQKLVTIYQQVVVKAAEMV